MEREFDVIIFGASGFTGERVVEEMSKDAAQLDIRWAVAGRNRHKVQQILVEVQKRVPDDLTGIRVFEADVTDQTSLDLMCENTKLIINCVGPYAKYGEPVITACLKHRTHIVDMAVEISHIHNMILQYFYEAESRKVYVITACGIGHLFYEMAVPILQEKFKGGIDKIDVHIQANTSRQSVNFGTWESCVNMSNGIYEIIVGRQKIYLDIIKKPRSKWSILSLSCPIRCIKETNGVSFYFPSILHTADIGLDMREKSEDFLNEKPNSGLFSCGLVKKSTSSEKIEDVVILNFTAVAKGWSEKQPNDQRKSPDKTVVLYGSGPLSASVRTSSVLCSKSALKAFLVRLEPAPRMGRYVPVYRSTFLSWVPLYINMFSPSCFDCFTRN